MPHRSRAPSTGALLGTFARTSLAVAAIAGSTWQSAHAAQCTDPDALVAQVVALDHPMVFNRLGAQNVNWMMYALRHDILDVSDPQNLRTLEDDGVFAQVRERNRSRSIALRPDLRPRPLVLRVPLGRQLQVEFTNLLAERATTSSSDDPANPFPKGPDPLPGTDHPTERALDILRPTPHAPDVFHIDDQVASRVVGFHPQGLELVGSIGSDSSHVGRNPSVAQTPNGPADAGSLARPGNTVTYCFRAAHEGAFLVSNEGAAFGGEGTAGNSGVGLFALVVVEPKGARMYRSQVTEEELRLATVGVSRPNRRTGYAGGHPIVDYEARYPNAGAWAREGKAGKPVLNMLDGNRIVHGDINAIVAGPLEDGRFAEDSYPLESRKQRNPTVPNRLEPFREFASVFHDENAATQAFPYFFEHPELGHTLHGVRDAFMINYGSGGIGAEIIANRLRVGPMHDCVDCAYEEFFLSSSAVGDAAMLVDTPANVRVGQCQPEFLAPENAVKYAAERQTYCTPQDAERATRAYYPHDPANVHHSYIGDAVRFRNVHTGKEQHIFHLHNHQWLFNPNDDNSNYIDAQALAPGSTYTYEIAFGGSGNRNRTVGDAIFHCHLYPHFAQGMWYMWRIHDVFESGTALDVTARRGERLRNHRGRFHRDAFALADGRPSRGSRALPDGEIVAGTPIPAIVPLPGKGMAPVPGRVEVAPRRVNGKAVGSVARVRDRRKHAGYPFFIAGVEDAVGGRPTTPPLDMAKQWKASDGTVQEIGGHDGGLPRHALRGYSEGGETEEELTRLSAYKHVKKVGPRFYPELGTDLEKLAMKFHAAPHHASSMNRLRATGASGSLSLQPARFLTNGGRPSPGAPYNEPCMDDRQNTLVKAQDGQFFGGTPDDWIRVTSAVPDGIQFGADTPRIYKGANIQLDVEFNKSGYHYPQQRILTLWNDVVPTLAKTRPPEPLVLRMNTFDCARYLHTNLVPEYFWADDYQITTPTDVIGQHIHLPKWDLTSADGGANGWNYEDGTLSPEAVRTRIRAINLWNASRSRPVLPSGTTGPLRAEVHPVFGDGTDPRHPKPAGSPDCATLFATLPAEEFEKNHPHCHWLGARTTIQKWFSDPVVNRLGVHRGLGITFTHDHLGPSTHQQIGLYATMLTEPPGSTWWHNEQGYQLYTRDDGGPTSWQAVIAGPKGRADPLHVDTDRIDDAHREFFLQFGDFQHAYVKGAFYGVDEKGKPKPPTDESYRLAINPSYRKPAGFPDVLEIAPRCPGGGEDTGLPGSVYTATSAPPRPCPEAISADDVGMMVVNYRNEPVAGRVFDPDRMGSDGRKGAQSAGPGGDLAYAFQTRTDRRLPEFNSVLGNTSYPEHVSAKALPGDPFTPIMRLYSGDRIRMKVQAGSHEHEHNIAVNAMAWLQGGSGFGEAPNSGWRGAQNAGLSEQFTFAARITDYMSNRATGAVDRLYAIDSGQDGIWTGVWGLMRSLAEHTPEHDPAGCDPANPDPAKCDMLLPLPSNPGPTLVTPGEGGVTFNDCPRGAPVRRYFVSAVRANRVLTNDVGATIPARGGLDAKGGTLVFNPRRTSLAVQIEGEAEPRQFSTGPLHDPTAVLFVRDRDLVTRPGRSGSPRPYLDEHFALAPTAPAEPLVLRAAAGECLQVIVTNRLPSEPEAMPDLDGYTVLTPMYARESSPGSGLRSFNNNLLRPSNVVGLHSQLVKYDVGEYDGTRVGMNPDSMVAPGTARVYQWYAGVLHAPVAMDGCGLDPDALGPPPASQDALIDALDRYRDANQSVAAATAIYPPGAVRSGANAQLTTDRKRRAATARELPAACLPDPRFVSPFDGGSSPLVREAEDDRAAGDDTMYDRFKVHEQRLACEAELLRRAGRAPTDPRSLAPESDVLSGLPWRAAQRAGAAGQPGGNAPALRAALTRAGDTAALTRRRSATRFVGVRNPADPTDLSTADPARCRFVPVELGASNLAPPDRIKQGQKSLVGALVVEPVGARWQDTTDDVVVDRQSPHGSGKVRVSRASALVRYTPRAGAPPLHASPTSGQSAFRDLVVVHQKGLNLRFGNGMAVPTISPEAEGAAELLDDGTKGCPEMPGVLGFANCLAPEDAHDAGQMAINYGTEPMWFRVGLPPQVPFGKEGLGGARNAWQVFSNTCCTPDEGTSRSPTPNVGEPYVPVFTTTAGMETRLRVLMPTGVGRATVFGLHGHGWARDPYRAERLEANGLPRGGQSGGADGWGVGSIDIGRNVLAMSLGGQESVTPMAHFDILLPSAGGCDAVPGDYLFRDHGGFGITSGLWGILRVEPDETQGHSRPRPWYCTAGVTTH